MEHLQRAPVDAPVYEAAREGHNDSPRPESCAPRGDAVLSRLERQRGGARRVQKQAGVEK